MTIAPNPLAISAVRSDEPSSHTIIESVIFFNFVITDAIFFSSLYAGIPIVIFNIYELFKLVLNLVDK